MKKCPNCLKAFDAGGTRQRYCSNECRTETNKRNQASTKRGTGKKRKRCANNKCNNFISLYTDSIYCSSCFLDDGTIEKDLKKIKRLSSA